MALEDFLKAVELQKLKGCNKASYLAARAGDLRREKGGWAG